VAREQTGVWSTCDWLLILLSGSCSRLHAVSFHYCRPCSTDQEGQMRGCLWLHCRRRWQSSSRAGGLPTKAAVVLIHGAKHSLLWQQHL